MSNLTFKANLVPGSTSQEYALGSPTQIWKIYGLLTGTASYAITAGNGGVTGVKGNSESSYRTGQVNITAANIGLGNVENTKLSTWTGSTAINKIGTLTTGSIPWSLLTSIPIASTTTIGIVSLSSATNSNSLNVAATPAAVKAAYDLAAANNGTVTSIKIKTSSPLSGGNDTAVTTSGEWTLSLANAYGDTKNPYGTKTANYVLAGPASGSAAAPTFRQLGLSELSGADDVKAIEALSGTTGLLKKTAANTWTLDTTAYTTNTGTVTKVTAGTGLNTTADLAESATKGNITTTGTLYLTLSGVTANTYGNTSQLTPSHGGTFNIPYFTVDKYGRVTSASTTTVKLPTDNNTDTKVNVVKRGTTKSYILGDTTAPPNSAAAHTAVAESYIYMTSTAGQMSAKSYSFNDGASTPTEKAQMIYNTTTGCLEIIVA